MSLFTRGPGCRLLAILLLAGAARAQDVLVVAPDAFRPALVEWRAHRARQGHRLVVRAPQPDLAGLVKAVFEESNGALRFVLLVGDVKQIPCAYRQGEVIKRWERDPRIANDNACADLDGDSVPDLAVGRIPADNAGEARAMLAKVMAYEKNRDFTAWRRRVNVIAGVGGFGRWDRILEGIASEFLTKSIPNAYDLHVTYANPTSPFCPPPSEVEKVTVERFNEGALIVAYLGHGSRLRLDRVRFGRISYDIFSEEAAYRLEARRGAPIAVFVACSTGHFDGAPDCLGELALKQPAGPVAVIASSRVSMPYANGVVAKELLEALLCERAPTVGEMLLSAKQRFLEPKKGDKGRQKIEGLAVFYEWNSDKRRKERAEHLYLYNLLGDPTTRIAHTGVVELEVRGNAGEALVVTGTSPVDGEALVELVRNRTPHVAAREGDDRDAFARSYERANAWVRAATTVKVEDGRFLARLEAPPAGDHHVRVYVRGSGGAAIGARAAR